MDEPLPKGTAVRQKVAIVSGQITNIKFNPDSRCFEYCVAYAGEDGEVHERWFDHHEVEAIPAAETAGAQA